MTNALWICAMRRGSWLATLTFGLSLAASAEEAPFELFELPISGRAVSAGFADLDGDGRADVYAVTLSGIPPEERRELRIHYQGADGGLAREPDWKGAVAEGAAAYDVADLPDGPGEEILLALRHGVRVLSFAGRELSERDIVIPGEPTFATAPDERGLDRLRLARDGLDAAPLLLVPGQGDCSVLTPAGELIGRLDVGHRANYFIPPRPGPLVGESEIEKYYDVPRLDLGDVDGDGQLDLIAATRHEVRVFVRHADGRFPQQPSRRLPLRRLTDKDQIRGSGHVRVVPEDLDRDGRVDLAVVSTTGGLLEAKTLTTFHLNRGGTWDLARPDHSIAVEKAWNAIQLLDLEGDGSVELVEARTPLSLLEMVEILVTRAVDVEVRFFRANAETVFENEPFLLRKVEVPFQFETFSPLGFLPTLEADVNGDGFRDRLESGDGEAIEIYLGGGARPYAKRDARQPLATAGTIEFGDLDGDGLTDFLLFDRRDPGASIRIGVNRGVLPGSRVQPVIRAPADAGG